MSAVGDARKRIADLVDASSLGTPEAKALRASVSDEQARVVARARELAGSTPDDREAPARAPRLVAGGCLGGSRGVARRRTVDRVARYAADAAGVAEMHFGAGKGEKGVVLLVTVGTGIGSALFVDGTLVPNTELGWLMLDNGKLAEPYAADRVRKDEDLSWSKWAGRFQEYLDRVEFLFGPDLIIVGGGISKPSKWEKFAHELKTSARLVPAQLRNEAGIVGAAQAALLKPRENA